MSTPSFHVPSPTQAGDLLDRTVKLAPVWRFLARIPGIRHFVYQHLRKQGELLRRTREWYGQNTRSGPVPDFWSTAVESPTPFRAIQPGSTQIQGTQCK